jgi:hypothetical protein
LLKTSGRAVVGRGIVEDGIATAGHGNKNSAVPPSAPAASVENNFLRALVTWW